MDDIAALLALTLMEIVLGIDNIRLRRRGADA